VKAAKSGRSIPLDPVPVAGGNIDIDEDGDAVVAPPSPVVERFVSHFTTCPDADGWRTG